MISTNFISASLDYISQAPLHFRCGYVTGYWPMGCGQKKVMSFCSLVPKQLSHDPPPSLSQFAGWIPTFRVTLETIYGRYGTLRML